MESISCVVQGCAERTVNINFLKTGGERILIKCGKAWLGLRLQTEVG